MGKIKDLEKVKEYLVCGQMKCSDVWAVDGQEKLKGDPLKAFERDLETICSFSKSKIGRSTYYQIKEIFAVTKEKLHGNKISMIGNTNKLNKLTYAQGSDSEFIAAVIINKLEYLERYKDESFKSLYTWMKVLGMNTKKKNVELNIKQAIGRNFIKLNKLGLIDLEIKFNTVIEYENRKLVKEISEEEYKEYNKKSKEAFKEAVGDITAGFYKNVYNFCENYDWQNKNDLLEVYWFLMNTNMICVFKTYKVTLVNCIERIENPIYIRLHEVIFDYDYEVNIQSLIRKFVYRLEKNEK